MIDTKRIREFYRNTDDSYMITDKAQTFLLLDEIECLTSELAAEREQHRWIPVSERLPEVGEVVLGWHSFVKLPFPYTFTINDQYDAPGHFVDGDCCYCEDITHWMPLPAPYKEGEG